MTDENSLNDGDERERIHRMLASRRKFLEAAGAVGLAAGMGGVAYGQETTTQQDVQTYEFGGVVDGWQGRSPSEIEGETNPTLQLEPGTEYEIVWENVDGQPHDFVIQDAEGNDLVGTDVFDQQGETYSFTFTASEEMAQYICTVHPTSMVGDVQVGQGTQQAGQESERYVPEGPTVGVEQIASEPLVNPVTLRSVPGQENTHLIVDQTGQVYVLQDGELREEPFMDISDSIVILEDTQGGFDRSAGFDERGLLGFDFHPNFQENGQFYVRYSSRDPVGDGGLTGPGDRQFPDDWDHVEVLSEFQVADGDGLSANPDSERVLLEVPEPQFNHNAGEVVFGPDGYLYTSYGDGGDGNDTGVGHGEDWYDGNEGGNAQNIEDNLLGTVLRIDVDSEGDDRPYGIPDDNPLVDTSAYDEIFAYGLRNPWRLSFDGDQLITADVGQALFEEVDVIESGGNYGWNVKEGYHCFNAADATSPPADCPDAEPDEDPYDGSEFVDPVLEYPHQYQTATVGISITGGYVYQGDAIDELDGRYVFGDWSTAFAEPQGRIFVATPDGGAEGTTAEATEGTATADATTAAGAGETTTADGTAAQDKGTQPEEEPEGEVDVPAPDEQSWQWEEVMIEGSDSGQINRFIQAFGRDADGEMYVLASQTGRLEGPNGEIYRLVPSGEGEDVEQPTAEIPGGEDEGEAEETTTAEGGEETTTAEGGEETTTADATTAAATTADEDGGA